MIENNYNLKVLEYIKTTKNWRRRLSEKPYFLDIKENEDYILLKYKVPYDVELRLNYFDNEIVRECRGLIIRKEGLKPVCVPFFKFGNYGESYVPNIDWDSARIQEKLDGSIIKLWYDSNEWRISTNGMINAFEADLGTSVVYNSYGDLFIKACEKNGLDFNTLDINNTYMFELVSPFNMQVVDYGSIDIYLIGIRNNNTMEEISISDIEINVKKPYEYKVKKDLNSLIEIANKFGTDKEGFVVVDKNFNRVKIKGDAYVKAHYLNNNNAISDKKILELVLQGEIDEFITYLPQYLDRVVLVQDAINEILEDMDYEYREMKTELSQNISNSCNHISYLFNTIKHIEPLEYIKSMPIDKAYKYIFKDEESENE